MEEFIFDRLAKRKTEIEAQRAKLKAELERLDAEQSKLAEEERELVIAERVFGRLSGIDSLRVTPPEATSTDMEAKKDAISIPKQGSPRPEGIPTTRRMIDEILVNAERRGKRGLAGRELIVEIHNCWWPGVGWNDVLPEALRLVRKKVLGRDGHLFVRVHSQEVETNQAAE